jgi:hypothetical protein
VILAPELGGGYGTADLVIGRCLIEVKTAFDPAAAMGNWLNQVVAYALLDWSNALGVDTVAVCPSFPPTEPHGARSAQPARA